MADLQPAPTYADVLLQNEVTGQPIFNPIWLRWFLTLAEIVNAAGGLTLSHNSLADLQGGQASQYYHLTAAQHTAIGTLGSFAANTVVYSDSASALKSEAAFGYNDTTNVLTVDGSTFGLNTQIGGTFGVTGNTTLTGDLAVNGGDLTSSATTFNLLNATVTTLNLGSAVTSMRLGATTGAIGITSGIPTIAKIRIGGTWTNSAGATPSALSVETSITAASGSTTRITQVDLTSGAITTQGATETIPIVSRLYVNEPIITVGSGDSVTLAATVYIANAPTEGATNAALYVASGDVIFVGDLAVNGGDLTSSATTFNLLNATVTTLNIGAASTSTTIGAATGVMAFGTTAVNYIKNRFAGTLTSGGGSTVAIGTNIETILVGANGDTSYQATYNINPGGITTQGNSETIGIVASARFAEPGITVGTGDTVTIAATVYIVNAPTEGGTNAALYVASGLTYTAASVAGTAGFRIPHGTAPSSPVNGDIWTTTAGLFVRINGSTVGPLS